MLDVYIWSVLITGLLFTSFGLLSIFKNPHDFSTKLFAFLSFAFAVWSYSWFAMLLTEDQSRALFFARLLNFGATFFPVFFLHWVSSLLRTHKINSYLLGLCYVATAFFAAVSFSSFYIIDVQPILYFHFWPIAGPIYTLFLITVFALSVSYALVKLFLEYRMSVGANKMQILYVLAGSIAGFGGGLTNFPLMYGIESIQPIGIFATMASPVFLGFAALNYNLMNVKQAATNFFIGALNIFLVINFLKSDSRPQFIINGVSVIFVFLLSIVLIRSIKKEVKSREKVEALASQLAVANGELHTVNARLKELDQQKSEFVSIASHQLRSPLTAIKGYASMLLEDTPSYGNVHRGAITPAGVQALDRVFKSANNLVLIIEDLLNISRIEQGRMQYEMAPVDVRALVQEIADTMMVNARERGLTLSYAPPQTGAYTVRADIGKLRQVIGNVIDNAIKYTPRGGIVISVSNMEGKIQVRIKDTGIGLLPQTISKLFQKFSRAEGAGKVNVTGTGIGLYIAQEIMKAHNGRIWAESEGKGKGSTFIVEIPSA